MDFFGFASRLNNREFILAGGTPIGPVGFMALDDAVAVFKNFYDLLTLNRHDPSYLGGLADLLLIAPAIYKFDADDLHSIMEQWREGQVSYKADIQILSVPHLLAPMKGGFLNKYMAMDIVKDIEQKISIDPEGRIQLQTFKAHYMLGGGTPPPFEELTDNKLKEELRKRGLT